MKHVTIVAGALCVCALTLTGCSGPLAPPSGPSETLVVAAVAQWTPERGLICEWQDSRSVSGEIGPSGGTLAVGSNRVRIPAGALRRPVELTLSVPAGQMRMVRIEASGPGAVAFERPAAITISYAGCEVQSEDSDRTVTVESAAFSTYAVMY